MGIQARILDYGLSALVAECDRIFLCTQDPTSYDDANTTHLAVKSGTRGAMFAAIGAGSQPGRLSSLVPFTDGDTTADGTANYLVAADSTTQTLMFSKLISPQLIQSGGKFSVSASVLYVNSAQPFAANLAVASPVIGTASLAVSVTTAVSLNLSSPTLGKAVINTQARFTALPKSISNLSIAVGVLKQKHVLLATAFSKASNVFGTPAVTSVAPKVLTAANKAISGAIVFSKPALGVVATTIPGAFNVQNGNFSISWDASATVSLADALCGLSVGAPSGVTSFACIVRFSTAGVIDARNGGAYAAAASIPYSAGQSFHCRLNVRISTHTYDVYITPSGQSEILLASNYSFRTEQNSVTTLDYLGHFAVGGDVTLTNMAGPPALTIPPVVNAQTFSLADTGASWVSGVAVGTMTALYSPTSWSITAGNSSGYFAIDNSGNITVTSTGISALGGATGSASLTVQATNTYGNGTGTATINYAPASAIAIPMSFTDAMFTGMTTNNATITLQDGDDLTRTSITEFSGDPSIYCNGNNVLTLCRVNSAECVRLTYNDLTIDQCYLEATGSGEDHADVVQAYSNPASSGGTFHLTRTHIVAHPTAATAGVFIADGWAGTINIDNTIFNGGPYGLRILADGNVDLYMNNVYFVGPFGFGLFDFSGCNIMQWTNVRNATISNGVLVPGSAITSP